MARNDKQNRKMRDKRRERILASARKLFATRGLAATKISHIAVDSKSAQGLIYHYFSSKDELFVVLIEQAFTKMNEAVRALATMELPAHVKVKLALTELFKKMAEQDEFSHNVLMIAQATASNAIPKAAKEVIKRSNRVPYDVMATIIKAAQDSGEFRSHAPEELSQIFWALIKGFALHKATFGKAFKAPDVNLLYSLFAKEQS